MIKEHLGELPSAIYYVTGPPGFVAGMRAILADLEWMTTIFAPRSSVAIEGNGI